TGDERTIRSWWDRWPWANIGIATGAVSGLVVVDVDPAHGGTESLHHLQSLMGSLPATLTASTGGGGWHLVLTHPGGVEVRRPARRAGRCGPPRSESATSNFPGGPPPR